MTIDDQIAHAKGLIAQREEIDRQLAELFAGAPIAKKTVRCTVCGQLGHNAKSCPDRPNSTAPDSRHDEN